MTQKLRGGEFLSATSHPQQQFSPEDFSAEHLDIARSALEFWNLEVEPNLDAIRHKQTGVLRAVLRKSAELGFTAISIPERFGGMELDLPSALIVEECFARDASYLVTHGGQAGIGALALVHWGTPEQQAKYLPKVASAEFMAAYALTEPQAGSDALNVRTRADLSSDGTHYILNGQKMWITNGGMADLFTVFAKVGAEHFTAFLVERAYPGVTAGAEENKMGLHGSSTTAVFFDNVPVPVENVLGEVGRGHIVAFNILNFGRLKIGAYAAGASKDILRLCVQYAKERKAFGSAIADFGAIQHKLAEMAVNIYAVESMTWRVVGLVQDAMREGAGELTALEEFAIECSIVKVFASEAVGRVADEGVQIHGGFGYHHDYAVERHYRDARIFRIFEGTNEINRQLIVTMLLKRMARGRLTDTPPPAGTDVLAQAKSIAWATLSLARETFGASLEKNQEVVARIADIIMQSFAIESVVGRAQKTDSTAAAEMAAVLIADAASKINFAACEVFCACSQTQIPEIVLGQVDAIGLRRKIARRVLDAGRFVV